MDQLWDEAAGLLWSPGEVWDPEIPDRPGWHMVRESVWYALGLLMRSRPGDADRAARVLDVVLNHQFDRPGQPYHGTFRRAPEEPDPPVEPIEWKYYDPNWREFIITTIAVILLEYEDKLPRRLLPEIDVAIRKAVEGALERGLRATYTNIALMHAFMLCFAGKRLGEPGWIEQGENMAREIYRLFKRHDTFEEYNSPTYYGVDLYALGLWRAYPPTPLLRELGSEMEALLWTDIAAFYHAGLRNLSGPFDRSYGMDMRHYAATVGEWIWLVTGSTLAPFPDTTRRFAHAADFCYAPCYAILGARVPAEAKPHLQAFQGEHQIERIISDSPCRVATAWLSQDIMLGAEHSSGLRRGTPQFHPATIYWRVGAEDVGWIRLRHAEPADARASVNRLDITGAGELVFQVSAPGARPEAIQHNLWRLPGLTVQVETDAEIRRVEQQTDCINICYSPGNQQSISCTLITTHTNVD